MKSPGVAAPWAFALCRNNESGRVIDRFQTSCDAGEELLLLGRLLLGRLLLCSCFLLSHRNHSLSEPRVMFEPLLPGKIGLKHHDLETLAHQP